MNISDVEATLKNGPYAWPGGYPVYFIAKDGEPLSFQAVKDNLDQIRAAMWDKNDPQWEIVAVQINWEETDLVCSHTNLPIECAYPED